MHHHDDIAARADDATTDPHAEPQEIIPMPPSVVQLHLTDTSELDARRGPLAPSLEEVARRDLERYHATLAAELRRVRLTEDEAFAICDVLSGTWVDATTAHLLWTEVDDAQEDGLAERWSIDAPALVARLRALGPAAQLAICDGVERWRILAADTQDVGMALATVGLVRERAEIE